MPPEAADGTPLHILVPYLPGTTVGEVVVAECERGIFYSYAGLGVKRYSSSIIVSSSWSVRPEVGVTRGPRERLSVVPVRGVEVVVQHPATDELAYNSRGAYTSFTYSALYFAMPHPEGGSIVTYICGQVPPDLLLSIAEALIRERSGGTGQ
ncbi:hypothetical protein HRbin29_00175 [bacterium HR29]|nr:hypothetical protein HRbin29_00175 [bacterium HR29]